MYLYPRLSLYNASLLLSELKVACQRDGIQGAVNFVKMEHPHASPFGTGGRAASREQIEAMRQAVIADMQSYIAAGESIGRTRAAEFDRSLGRTLHKHLAIVPGDAAHSEVWNFLTLVIFPDLAVMRFPDIHNDRFLGTQRNVLRRTWVRQEVLGDLLSGAERPLGEDELVGMFERTALARNRKLMRALARVVTEYDRKGSRSDWARPLYKKVTFLTGPRFLDILEEAEIESVVRDIARSIPD